MHQNNAGRCADPERSPRAEAIGDPADDRRADRRRPQRDGEQQAMTRPRISARSIVHQAVRRIGEGLRRTPMTTSTAPNSQIFGVIAANAKPMPKIARRRAEPEPRLLAPAASSAPATDPTAMTEVRNPYWLAPPWKTETDIVEMKIGKLSPNVPTRKSIQRMAFRSGRGQT